MTESGTLVKLKTTSYIHDLMKFVVHQRGMEWNDLGINDMGDIVERIFQEDVGKIVVAYAKGEDKSDLIRQSGAVRLIQTMGDYYSYCIRFQAFFFEHRGRTPDAILKYFVFAIENCILMFTLGLLDAPVLTVDVIVYCLMIIDDGRFLRSGGLQSINETAVRLLTEDPSLITAYETGTFAW